MSKKTNININNIENKLRQNPSSISINELIAYVKINSNNTHLDPNNNKITTEYLNKINSSYFYENIFTNTSNYTSIMISFIGLLIPFYYFYPRFYKLGFTGLSIGIISFITLLYKVKNLYSPFNYNIHFIFIFLTFIIYVVFFVVLNKLNHISLFFISAILSYILISYFTKLKLLITTTNKAIIKTNSKYTPYNLLLEEACYQITIKYNLSMKPSLLYSYLTSFEIENYNNNNKIIDVVTNIISPLISVLILYLFGNFMGNVINNDKINLFPLIGTNDSSTSIFCCQSNYILPNEINPDIIAEKLLSDHKLDDYTYDKTIKTLLRIFDELIKMYNPTFNLLNDVENNTIIKNLTKNKIFKTINKLLKLSSANISNIKEYNDIKILIEENEDLPYEEKEKLNKLVDQLQNTLSIKLHKNPIHENTIELAKEALLTDNNIPTIHKVFLKNTVNEFINNFNDIILSKDGLLFGSFNNIFSFSWISKNIQSKSNNIFKFILKLLSGWLLLGKPIGSPILMTRYIITETGGLINFINDMSSGNSIIWKYFSMGQDTLYFENKYDELKNKDIETNSTDIINIFYSILSFIILTPILYMYNNINFGMSMSPSWHNIIYQCIFIINILGNLYTYNTEGSLLLFNIKFIIAFIIILAIIILVIFTINYMK